MYKGCVVITHDAKGSEMNQTIMTGFKSAEEHRVISVDRFVEVFQLVKFLLSEQ